jgi:hypothetical protein
MTIKTCLFLVFTMTRFIASAQHGAQDGVKAWQLNNMAYARSGDSFRIIAESVNSDRILLEARIQKLGDSLNCMAGRDIKMNVHNDPRIDSLNKKLVELNLIGNFLNERFEYRLMQIDSCLSSQNELDKKIHDAGLKK